jgi:hypothetical protein
MTRPFDTIIGKALTSELHRQLEAQPGVTETIIMEQTEYTGCIEWESTRLIILVDESNTINFVCFG